MLLRGEQGDQGAEKATPDQEGKKQPDKVGYSHPSHHLTSTMVEDNETGRWTRKKEGRQEETKEKKTHLASAIPPARLNPPFESNLFSVILSAYLNKAGDLC